MKKLVIARGFHILFSSLFCHFLAIAAVKKRVYLEENLVKVNRREFLLTYDVFPSPILRLPNGECILNNRIVLLQSFLTQEVPTTVCF